MTSLPAGDVRDRLIGLRANSPARTRTLARLHSAAARQGVSPTGLARRVLLDASGYADTERRRTDRRPNQQPRPGQGDPRLMIRVSAREHLHITGHATDHGQTITDWAWTVLEQAMRQQRK